MSWGEFALGVLATHLFWAVVIAGWWGIILRNSDPQERESFERDAEEIRERIRETFARVAHAKNAGRN